MNDRIPQSTSTGPTPADRCPACGRGLPPDAPRGFCPVCLLGLCLEEAEEVPAKPEARGVSAGQPLSRFGDYELISELGRGGMGIVYKARQISIGRMVALKMLTPSRLLSKADLDRFDREARTLAALDHPNILPLYEVGEQGGQHFYTTRCIESGSLGDCFARGEMLLPAPETSTADSGGMRAREEEIAGVLAIIARAVHCAHQSKILHRDLKPQNILVDASGRPFVVDFGLAKMIEGDSGETLSQTLLGTPAYMAPEQADRSRGPLTPAADIYSLGAILFQMLTGRPVFQGVTPILTLKRVLEEEPESPRRINPAVERDLDTICLTCLQKDPSHRYSSAVELAEELERFIRREPIRARSIKAPERMWRWSQRHPLAARLIGLTAISILAALIGVTWQWRKAERAREATLRANGELAGLVNLMRFHRAEDLFSSGRAEAALPLLALVLSENPHSHEAASRILSALDHFHFALPVFELPHSNLVRYADFNPAGNTIATASDDGTARLWDLATGQPIGSPLQHSKPVNTARFSPDGSLVLTASEDGTACLWEAPSGRLRLTLRHESDVITAHFSPDGKLLLTASTDGTARLWNASTGQPASPPLHHGRSVADASFSPDGLKVVTAGNDHFARVWSARDGDSLHLELAHQNNVKRAVFSPDSRKIATASWDGTARIWSATTGAPMTPAMTHLSRLDWVEFDGAGRRVATVCNDGTARIWDAETGLPLTPLLHHGERVRYAEFSPDGSALLTASSDSTARLWDCQTGRPVGEPLQHNGPVHRARFHRDGNTVLTASEDHTARLWRLPRPEPAGAGIVVEARAPIRRMGLSSDGRRLATLTSDRTLRLWDADSGQPCSPPLACSNSIESFTFDPASARLVAGGWNNGAGVWDAISGHTLLPRLAEGSLVHYAAFSLQGDRIVTASADKAVRVWDAATGQPLSKPMQHEGGVSQAVFSPDGRRLATGSGDGGARVWDAATARLLVGPMPHGSRVETLQFTLDGSKLVTRSRDGVIRLWNSESGAPLPVSFPHHQGINSASLSPDGGRLLTISRSDRSVQVWNLVDSRAVTPPIRLDGFIAQACFSPEGGRIATACGDATARVWDARSGLPVTETFYHAAKVNAVVFTPDGQAILTASEDGTVRRWPVPAPSGAAPGWLGVLAQSLAGASADANGGLRSFPVNEFFKARQAMMDHSRQSKDFYGQWARRFLERAREPSQNAK